MRLATVSGQSVRRDPDAETAHKLLLKHPRRMGSNFNSVADDTGAEAGQIAGRGWHKGCLSLKKLYPAGNNVERMLDSSSLAGLNKGPGNNESDQANK